MLAISLIVVMVIASLGAGLIQMHGAIARRQLQAIDNKRALYIAEAGLSEAFMAIAHGKSGEIGSEEIPAIFGNGLFWVEVAEQPDQTVAIVSNGLCESGRFSLAMTVKRQISPIGSLGLFGAESVTIGAGAIIDGYDSQAGSYASQVDAALAQESTGEGARITSNAEIQIAATATGGERPATGDLTGTVVEGEGTTYSTWVFGDAVPGPDAGVLADPGVLIAGNTMPALKPVILEPLTPPANLDAVSSLNHSDRAPLVLSNVETQYRKVHVEANSELVLEGPVTIVSQSLSLEPGAKLTIDTTNGPVMVYVSSFLNLAEGSILANLSEDPTQVAFVVGATAEVDVDGDGLLDPPVQLGAEGEFYGLLYAPETTVSVPSKLRLYGCLTGASVVFEAGSHFSYDKAMASTGVAISGLPGLLSWRIVELPDAAIVKHRTDPIRTLELAGVTPIPSSQAYVESYVRIKYRDLLDNSQTYQGLESSFDWNQVSELKDMRWAESEIELDSAPSSSGQGSLTPATSL